jgi:hypothetical protein
MKLRPELEPNILLVEKLYFEILTLIAQYDDAHDNEDESKIKSVINKIRALTGKNINEDDLFEYWEAGSAGELAFSFALPEPLKVGEITESELLEIIKRRIAFNDEGISNILSEAGVPLSSLLAYQYYSPLLEKHFSYPDLNQLFSRVKINNQYVEYTAEEISNKILAHKKINMELN